MRLSRIRIPGWNLTLLKLLIGAAFLAPLPSDAQCPSGYGPQTTTYSSNFTGTGSDVDSIYIPQYFSSMGYTLIGASVNIYLTTTATVKFQNTSTAAQNFTPAVGRSDNLTMNGNDIGDGNGSTNLPHTSLTAMGTPTDNKTYTGASIFTNYNIINYTIDNSDPNLNNFQGVGNVGFQYTSATYVNFVPTLVTATPTITDHFTFSVTYTYCQPTTLSSDIISFTATKQDDGTAILNWIVTNEQPGREYHVEVSPDGNKYTSYDTLPSDPLNAEATYTDNYRIQQDATGKLYFRIRQVDVNGQAAYSPVRIIDLGVSVRSGSGFSIYPNPPSDYINLLFPSGVQRWQVDVLGADGALVQRNYYSGTNAGRLDFQRKLSSGTYFARATDPESAKSYVAPFVIR